MFPDSHIGTWAPCVCLIYLPHFESSDFFPEIKMAAQPSQLSLLACMILAEGILAALVASGILEPSSSALLTGRSFFFPPSIPVYSAHVCLVLGTLKNGSTYLFVCSLLPPRPPHTQSLALSA